MSASISLTGLPMRSASGGNAQPRLGNTLRVDLQLSGIRAVLAARRAYRHVLDHDARVWRGVRFPAASHASRNAIDEHVPWQTVWTGLWIEFKRRCHAGLHLPPPLLMCSRKVPGDSCSHEGCNHRFATGIWPVRNTD